MVVGVVVAELGVETLAVEVLDVLDAVTGWARIHCCFVVDSLVVRAGSSREGLDERRAETTLKMVKHWERVEAAVGHFAA